MSEGGKPRREWRSFITDMIESGESILSFTEGLGIEEFQNDERTYKATLWDLRIIGEAASNIPDEVQARSKTIPWGEIVGMRNRITHAYEAIDVDIVWDAIQNDIPQMLIDLRTLLERDQEGEG